MNTPVRILLAAAALAPLAAVPVSGGDLTPGAVMILGAPLLAVLRGRLQQLWLLALPVLSCAHLFALEPGSSGQLALFDYSLTVARVDKLSLAFGYIFGMAAVIAAIYALHLRDRLQHICGAVYVGAATGAVFAGDLLTLFVYWELTSVASVFLVWAGGGERAFRAGMRYLLVQVGSGVLLLAGLIVRYDATGSLAFEHLGDPGTGNLGGTLIFLAFGIKCAFPLLHNWLQDAYPEASVTGTVVLSAFTTKLAVYSLARGFAGVEILVPIGTAMTVFPVFFAVIENDLRRVLAYSLNNQLGFMVVGIGIGTGLALNGAVSHAFVHIIYKALLFMSVGAVLYRTGTAKASELGMLYKSMPWTAFFCLVGAASISAFPLFSGFVTKSMTLGAAAQEGWTVCWFLLLFASAGVLHHSGIKIPFYGFYGLRDSGIRCREAPFNMLLAMGIAAFLCVAIGVFPQPLYDILPHEVDHFHAYTKSHVITQLQLLLFAMLAFAFLARRHLETPELPSVNLDFDWTYRKLLPGAVRALAGILVPVRDRLRDNVAATVLELTAFLQEHHGPAGILGRTSHTSAAVLIVGLLLALSLILYFSGS